MRDRWLTGVAVAGLIAVCAGNLPAQARNVSVGYLRAALGSIQDRASISIEGRYSGKQGLKDARGSYLRSKGYSQFTIADAETGLTFDLAYCKHDSTAFNELLSVKGSKLYVFQGHKGSGEGRADAFFVTSVTPVRDSGPAEVEQEDRVKHFMVTIIDNATSNRTVMMNVELGKEFKMVGSTLIIEEEKEDPNKVRVLK